jgi:hypothetical protein
MATKLKKLQINEVSLVDRGANEGARVVLFKRDAPTEIEVPQDSDPHFNASGRGPATDRLLTAYDNNRRQMAYPDRAFREAWADLTDDEKQQVRDEEAAVEAAREAEAAAAQKERLEQMTDDGLVVKAAHAIASGEIENTVRKSTWHSELRKIAADRQEEGETIERAVARLVQTDPDARALLKASLSGVADEAPGTGGNCASDQGWQRIRKTSRHRRRPSRHRSVADARGGLYEGVPLESRIGGAQQNRAGLCMKFPSAAGIAAGRHRRTGIVAMFSDIRRRETWPTLRLSSACELAPFLRKERRMLPDQIDALIEKYRAARRRTIDDVSLFLCGQDEDSTQQFLHFWNDKMEAEFLAIDNLADRGIFIWRLIESAMARVRAIELGAGVRSTRLN